MTENIKGKFLRENSLLEYWRKRYLGQGAVVVVIALLLCYTVLYYTGSVQAVTAVTAVCILVTYLMLKELSGSLQTRGEKIFWEQAEKLFGEVTFDYGLRCSGDTIPDAYENFKVCETYNSVSGENYRLEEKWLYSVLTIGVFPFTKTTFEGVCLAVNKKIDDQKIQNVVLKLQKAIGAQTVRRSENEEEIIFWLPTKKKIFYRLGLFQKNEFAYFIGRVENILDIIGGLKH